MVQLTLNKVKAEASKQLTQSNQWHNYLERSKGNPGRNLTSLICNWNGSSLQRLCGFSGFILWIIQTRSLERFQKTNTWPFLAGERACQAAYTIQLLPFDCDILASLPSRTLWIEKVLYDYGYRFYATDKMHGNKIWGYVSNHFQETYSLYNKSKK